MKRSLVNKLNNSFDGKLLETVAFIIFKMVNKLVRDFYPGESLNPSLDE